MVYEAVQEKVVQVHVHLQTHWTSSEALQQPAEVHDYLLKRERDKYCIQVADKVIIIIEYSRV